MEVKQTTDREPEPPFPRNPQVRHFVAHTFPNHAYDKIMDAYIFFAMLVLC